MPTYDPDLAGVLRSLQRQIDQINTSPPGPVSYGPGDHARFYGADGTTVLFEAVGGSGASVMSRGSLTSMTGLVDGIRDKNDAQDGVLSDHRTWLVGHGERLDGHNATLTSHGNRLGSAESRLSGHDSTLASHGSRLDGNDSAISGLDTRVGAAEESLGTKANVSYVDGWVGSLQSSIATRAAKDYADSISGRAELGITNARLAQERADSAYSRAGTGISNAATAQSRADAAYTLAASRAAQSQIESIVDQLAAIRARITSLEEWRASLGK